MFGGGAGGGAEKRRVGLFGRRESGRKTVVWKIHFIFMVAHMQVLVHD